MKVNTSRRGFLAAASAGTAVAGVSAAIPSEKFKEEYVRRYKYAKGESYGISYASLVPKGLVNALVAGRCIGADRRMQSSLRVMPCCYITGQAAGTAAAMAAKLGGAVRDVKTSELRARLAADGAYLG